MSKKAKIFIEDLVLVIASIIGVGFMSGAEIEHFFCHKLFFVLILIFVLLFVIFLNLIFKFKEKNKIKSFYELNKILFPKFKFINFIFIIFYVVLSASMLAGADALMFDVLGLTLPVVSILLNVFVYILIMKGVDGIKNSFSKFVPVLLLFVFINVFVNSFYLTSGFKNWQVFEWGNLNFKNIAISIIFPFLFFGSNFVLAINSIINVRSNNKKNTVFSSLLLLLLLLFGCITIMLNKSNNVMPLLSASKNLSIVFFWGYFVSLLFSIFSTLTVSTWNEVQLCNFNSNFSIIIILIVNLIISFLGFRFIIKYLYIFTGIIGIIYCITLAIKIKLYNKKSTLNKKENL